MTGQGSLSISPSHRALVQSAVARAFGDVAIDGIAPVGGVASGAFPFRVDAGGRRYLVRIEGVPSSLRNPHQYEALRLASAAGIGPRVHFIDEAVRVAVMDFIDERPLHGFPGGASALAQATGELLARLQRVPAFPHFMAYPDIVARLWAWVRRTGLFAPDVLRPYTDHLESIRRAYGDGPVIRVSSHNDPVPRNILFDGRRLRLIDWESAYRSDPLVDVAITLDNLAPTPELERILLRAWAGGDPEPALRRSLIPVRALTRLYYAGVFLSASAAASGPIGDRDLSVPTVEAFRRDLKAGTIRPGTPEAKHTLGKMYLASSLSGDVPPGLDAAVGEGHEQPSAGGRA